MRTLTWIVPLVGLLMAGCGGDAGGLQVAGQVQLTVHQPDNTNGDTGFTFPQGTNLSPPPGAASAFSGTCVRSATAWTITVSRTDTAAQGGLQSFSIDAPVSTSVNSAGESLKFHIGASEFSGSCAGGASPAVDNGVTVTAQCTGLHASGDARVVDAALTLTFAHCDGG